jgi:pyruvate formate lyase activating enzyme
LSQSTVEGTILHLQRLSTEDGPGIRTTVFFKGCPLRCAWCHNPESITPHPQVQWLENRCIACQTCIQACPHNALTWTATGAQRDRVLCQACGTCAEACPANAQELLGKNVSVEALVKELIKDRVYFEKSGGGVTLSGGEPALQPAFALALLQALRSAGIATALDTCGLTQPETLLRLAAESDVILYDIKLLDSQAHQAFTGVDNQRILNNLMVLSDYLNEHAEKELWIRTPLIPGATDGEMNLTGIGDWLAKNLKGRITRWEICAFNNLCRDKYRRLGLDWAYGNTPLYRQAQLDQALEWAQRSGTAAQKIFVTGAARAANEGGKDDQATGS